MTDRADQRGWGNPFAPGFEDRMVVVEAGGIRVRVHRDVADIFRYLNTALSRVYHLAGFADDWGYNRRPIRGYEDEWAATRDLKYLSNHSWGLAEDLDSSVNPMTSNLKASHEFISAVIDPILRPFGGRLVWGGEYATARKDYMHFEYVGTKSQAATNSATARRLLEPVTAHAATPPQPLGDDMKALFTYNGKEWITDGFQKREISPAASKAFAGLGVPRIKLSGPDAHAIPGGEQ